jgi:hypothetical protein
MSFVRWLGDDVLNTVIEATREAIDETTEAAAEAANQAQLDLPPHTASGHPWHGVTPRQIESVVSEPAEVRGSEAVGRFGDTAGRGDYGLFLERLQPYMRPAADVEFPELSKRIGERLP